MNMVVSSNYSDSQMSSEKFDVRKTLEISTYPLDFCYLGIVGLAGFGRGSPDV